jgi:hypothetical protein
VSVSHVSPGPSERLCVDVLLAALLPHNARGDRHRPAERVLGLAGTARVEDGLPG